MAIIKCKMCGGDLNLIEGASTAECEYCGSVQTVPKVDDEKKLTLFARANRLRTACEFDKAAGIYETIVADFPEEAEAYWGLVLCKYGIEYVDDPATGKKIPTCHRSSFDSIMDDSDLEQALENADAVARKLYRDEAKQLEDIRKGIIAVSAKEEPYDIFICYKETAENGDRTLDSVLAQDVYDVLTDKGYRVFFSRITLEDKLGMEYEPYIFAALNSVKIMLTFGTDYEYFNAVWVKNEWSRFLKLMAIDKDKYLIPCYKGIDAYDMPKEFSKLQAQDLGKVGAMQDLLRGISKILPKAKADNIVTQNPTTNANPLVMRGQFALDDGDWEKAEEYFERALDQDPRNSQAYLGKVLTSLRISNIKQIEDCAVKLDENKDFERAIQFADPATAKLLLQICEATKKMYFVNRLAEILNTILQERSADADKLEAHYTMAVEQMKHGTTEEDFLRLADVFSKMAGYKMADEKCVQCTQRAEEIKEIAIQAAEKDARRIAEIGTGKVALIVKTSINPLALANGSTYKFVIDGSKTYKVIAQKRDAIEELELPSGTHSVKLSVYGYDDAALERAIHIVEDQSFEVIKNQTVYLAANRTGLFNKQTITVSYLKR